jgi:hypothetical protein
MDKVYFGEMNPQPLEKVGFFILFFKIQNGLSWCLMMQDSIEKLLFLSNPLLAKVLLQIQTVPTNFISKLFKLFKLQHHCD